MDDLVDHDAIAAHDKRIALASDELLAARLAMSLDEEARTKAIAASAKAAANGGDIYASEERLEAATRRLSASSKRFAACVVRTTLLNDQKAIVVGNAHAGLYEDGIRRRLDASARWDAAKAEMEAAETDRKSADEQMREAMRNGTQDIQRAMDGPDPMRTRENEAAHWWSRGINPDAPRHPRRPMPTILTDEDARVQGLVRVSKDGVQTHVHPSVLAAHVAAGWAAE
jgi:hypothetical protein